MVRGTTRATSPGSTAATSRTDTGFYCVLDQQLRSSGEAVAEGQEDPNEGKGLFAFGQFGWADEDVAGDLLPHRRRVVLRGTFAGAMRTRQGCT